MFGARLGDGDAQHDDVDLFQEFAAVTDGLGFVDSISATAPTALCFRPLRQM
jgi:hypothetical protein